jgi:sugar/nucleoside kinase (ribokinase family)
MKTRNQLDELDGVIEKSAPVKTLSLHVAVTEPDLDKAVLMAFDLAKSAGQELDLDFDPPSDIGPAQFALLRVDG